MAYRKLTVNNENFDYVVGKSFLKIVNRTTNPNKSIIVPKEDIGFKYDDSMWISPAYIREAIEDWDRYEKT